jgi:hypothetical protein
VPAPDALTNSITLGSKGLSVSNPLIPTENSKSLWLKPFASQYQADPGKGFKVFNMIQLVTLRKH